ncbi:MAG: cell wall hydrolase [Peptococcaceae bacterium]
MKHRKTLAVVTAFFLGCSLMTGGGTALADTYRVQAGDSLYRIASSHKITVEELKRLNNLQGDTILAGQTLQVPDNYVSHRVAVGESLYLLAKRYGCTVDDIKKRNGLTSDVIQAGVVLKIPATGSTTGSTSSTAVTSSRGDSYQRTYTQEEWDMLAQVVYGEARGEVYEGQVAVAAVVLNRLESTEFPNTLYGVIFQKNAFTCVNDGQYYLRPNRTAYEAALDAMQGSDPTGGCLYYWNPVTATSQWIWTRRIETRIGNHVFGN